MSMTKLLDSVRKPKARFPFVAVLSFLNTVLLA